jgi:hypothetical protein
LGARKRLVKENNPFYVLGKMIAKARLLYMEGFNSVHLRIRKLHDVSYFKNKTYKGWSDKKYSSAVHKTVLVTFIVSFVFFQGFQYLFPYFNLWNPNSALAGSTQKIWNTLADFTNNNGATTNITNSNINLNSGDPKLSTSIGGDTDSTTAEFNTWEKSNTAAGTNNVYLLKPLGATATSGSECASGAVQGGVCYSPWIAGRAGTAMASKEVYNANLTSTYSWGPYPGSCFGPQCATELDPNYPSNYALVASNTVDFSAYPARNACKAIGGRLPYINELLELYAGQASYGNNFGTGVFWSATEYGTYNARGVGFSNGNAYYYNKDNARYVRCVR